MKIISNIKDWVSWKLINQIAPRLIDWFQSRSPRVYAFIIFIGTALTVTGGVWAIELNKACEAGLFCNTSAEAWLAYIITVVGLILDILAGKRPASDIKDIPKPPGGGQDEFDWNHH